MSRRRTGLIIAFVAGASLMLVLLKTSLLQQLMPSQARADAALYPDRDWRRGEPSKLNISVFTFSDRNRNGRYDTEDKPLARIAVRLTRPDGSTRIARSNVNGYANFSMQRDGEDADVAEAGKAYRFEVLPPPDWSGTTGNEQQTVVFKAIAGSIAGLGADAPPTTVGLAPTSRVSGIWPDQSGQPLRAWNPQQQIARDASLSQKGEFSVDLDPGVWELSMDGVPPRTVTVAYAPVVLAQTIDTPSPTSSPRQPVLVDFEDNRRSFIEKLASGYAGLSWDYLLAVDNQFYKGPGYVNGLMSGSLVAYNSSGHPVTITGGQGNEPFDFLGGYFSTAWQNAEGETLIVKAWRDDELVAEERIALSHLAPVYLQAEFYAITRLELSTAHYWQFVADDLEFAVRELSDG